jgi:ketosteroid isomerase-like protein
LNNLNNEAIALARDFLDHLAARNLAGAAACLSDDAVMVFPGGQSFTTLTALVEWSRERYLDVGKEIDGFDTVSNEDSTCTVYCYGTLKGHWPDGRPFSGIRFVDRFVVADGKIVHQDVWNDLAEHQP